MEPFRKWLCYPGSRKPTSKEEDDAHKTSAMLFLADPPGHTNEEKREANKIIDIIRRAEQPNQNLREEVDDIAAASGWSEHLARLILSGTCKIVLALENAKLEKVGGAVLAAYDKARSAAEDLESEAVRFVLDHRILCIVIALGVLAVVAPWVVEALGFFLLEGAGFTELGIAEGSWAALWQAGKYAGRIPKGSWFSYFQRMGMIWRQKHHIKA